MFPGRRFSRGGVLLTTTLLLGILSVELSVPGGAFECQAFCPSRSLQAPQGSILVSMPLPLPIPMPIPKPILVPMPMAQSTLASLPTGFGSPSLSTDRDFPLRRRPVLAMVSSSTPSSVVSTVDDDGNNGSHRRFMYMTEEEDRLLKEKGDLEERLMQRPTPLKALKLTGLARPAGVGAGKGMGGGFGGGFGGAGGKAGKKKGGKARQASKKQQPAARTKTATTATATATASPAVRALTRAIREDGLVRIDNVLSPRTADDLREYLIDLRKRAREGVESGTIENSQERFADVLLNQNRCDLKIPLGPQPVHEALLDLLNDESENASTSTSTTANPSLVRSVIEGVFDHYNDNKGGYGYKGSDASLWELNCFMSNSGARRQLVHADCVCLEAVPGLSHTDTNTPGEDAGEPILLTCFVALQDIDASMGPTVFMPGTHNIRSHNVFFETGRDADSTRSGDADADIGVERSAETTVVSSSSSSSSPKNDLMASSRSVVGAPLPKGSCILFDPRVLHCAGANACSDPHHTRALFYVTFKNPKVDSPGCPSTSGYGIATAELTMNELVSDLLVMERGAGDEGGGDDNDPAARRVPLLASFP